MQHSKVAELPVVNEDHELVALICRGDFKRQSAHPNASRDPNRQLLVGAAVGCNDETDYERAKILVDAGIDVISVETGDGVGDFAIEFLKVMKAENPGVEVI